MYKEFTIKITVILQVLVRISAKNQSREIEALEQEKGDLFKQINDAIDESVKLLRNGNDSEAILGVEYMQRLKQQINDANSSNLKDLDLSNNETRRSDRLELSMKEVADVFNTKKKKGKVVREENKLDIQKKIDEWLLQREIEKQKIREYKEKMKLNVKYEKCPRHGLGKNRRKVGDKKKKPYFPCCRKCCKKSYLGCL